MGMHNEAGWEILLLMVLLATGSVVVAHASLEGGADFDASMEHALTTNEFNEETSQKPQEMWNEEMQLAAEPFSELTQVTRKEDNTTFSIDEQMKHAASAVAVAQKLLDADKAKAEALINKAETTGKAEDKDAAAVAVHEARRLASNLALAQAKLKETTKKMESLPVSPETYQKEKAEKKQRETEKEEDEKHRERTQKNYAKQYGVKSQCENECTNEAVCEDNKCEPKFQTTCVTSGRKRCFHPRTCAEHTQRCADVPRCEQRGKEECDFPRKCVEEGEVCEDQEVCEKEGKDCEATFSPSCIDCASHVEACQKARTTATTCTPACKVQCGEDGVCTNKCKAGCKKMYDGYLAACKQLCTSCDPTKVCKVTCEKKNSKRICGRQCKRWEPSGSKTCNAPCLKMGRAKQCNDQFCSKYTVGSPVCDSPCLEHGEQEAGQKCQCQRWSKVKQETCKDTCKHSKCVPDCKPTFHTKCAQRAPMRCHRPRKCAVTPEKRCMSKRECAEHGDEVCKHKKKCVAYKNECSIETRCAEHQTSCVKDFSADCVACAEQSQSCKGARKVSEKCLASCQKQCADNRMCMEKCQTGCKTIQSGLLASCVQECPSCSKKKEVCQSTCKRTKQVSVCKKTCSEEITLSEKFCYKPCLKYGRFERCEDNYCPEYSYGDHVCEEPCVRYEASATKWCTPQCQSVRCKELCAYQPQQKCVQFEQKCTTEHCVERGQQCTVFDDCVIQGEKTCNTPSKCIKFSKECHDVTTCVRNTTQCTTDTSSCTECRSKAAACGDEGDVGCTNTCRDQCGTDKLCLDQCTAGCTSMSIGFARACKDACPMCDVPMQICKEVCAETEIKQVCEQVCAKKILTGTPQCTRAPCLATSRTKKCVPNACLHSKQGPKKCESQCVKYTSTLQKVCATDCSPNPVSSYGEYVKMSNATKQHEDEVNTCQQECYDSQASCHGDKLASCSKDYEKQVLSCLDSCKKPAPTLAGQYTVCMSKCDHFYSLQGIMECRSKSCMGLDGVELENCHKQCYEPRGRCRCGCDTNKEYVCKGYSCKCHEIQEGDNAGARAAAEAVASAAAVTADGIIEDPPSKNKVEGIGAQSVAESAAAEAAKYGGGQDEEDEDSVSSSEVAAKKAKHEEQHAIKQAMRQKERLKLAMQQGANASAFEIAKSEAKRTATKQKAATMLAATTGAKEASAEMVKGVVKLAAVAASKAAKAKSIAAGDSPEAQHAAVTAAAQAAVQKVIQPIMKLINTVAKGATEAALKKYPSIADLFVLSDDAKSEVQKTASAAAETEAQAKVTNEDKDSLLSDAEKAATSATQSKVLAFVKELATKAASHSRQKSEQEQIGLADAAAAAKSMAGRVAQDALDVSADIVHHAAKEAVESAITSAAAARMSGGGVTAQSIAAGVKSAMDDADTSAGGKSAERSAKEAAKQAIMKEVHRASSAASKEAAEKGKTKESQADAAKKAASDAMKKGRDVQKVVKGITEEKEKVIPPEVTVSVKPTTGESKQAEASPKGDNSTAGAQVLEAIQMRDDKAKKKVSHLQLRVQTAAQAAAEGALQESENSQESSKHAAQDAAKLAAKAAVLAEVRTAAMTAAKRAKEALADRDVESQTDAASAAAREAAKHVLTIAKEAVNFDTVAKDAARKAELHVSSSEDEPASRDHAHA